MTIIDNRFTINKAQVSIKKLLPHIVGGGMSNTNGMPLILFLNDHTVLKFIFHFKTDYDLCLERRKVSPKQWQGINSAAISDAINQYVPGVNGTGKIYSQVILRDEIKNVLTEASSLENCPQYIVNYFKFCEGEYSDGSAYDEMVIIRMKEYSGFLSNIYNSPSVSGFYHIMILGALYETVYFYFKVRSYLPSFRHNDLHMENIMIEPIEKVTMLQYKKFIVDRKEDHGRDNKDESLEVPLVYYIPYFGYNLRIIDFGLSEIPEFGINSVLDNTVSINKTVKSDLETKLLLRFITFDNESDRLFFSEEENYYHEGIKYNSRLFDNFKSKGPDDPRESMIVAEYHWKDV